VDIIGKAIQKTNERRKNQPCNIAADKKLQHIEPVSLPFPYLDDLRTGDVGVCKYDKLFFASARHRQWPRKVRPSYLATVLTDQPQAEQKRALPLVVLVFSSSLYIPRVQNALAGYTPAGQRLGEGVGAG